MAPVFEELKHNATLGGLKRVPLLKQSHVEPAQLTATSSNERAAQAVEHRRWRRLNLSTEPCGLDGGQRIELTTRLISALSMISQSRRHRATRVE